MEPEQHLAHLEHDAAALVDDVGAAPGAPVPSCPGWDVGALARHLGQTWGWAAAILRTGARADRPDQPEGASDQELARWFAERGTQVTRAVAELGVPAPDENCWTFGLPRSRRFWVRRMAQETALHGWDAALARGRRTPMDGELAADGVDELLTVLLPRLVGRNPGAWSGETVQIERTDGPERWLVRLDGEGVAVERGPGAAAVTVAGRSSDLYLWCTGRERVDQSATLAATGDRSLADRWSAEIAF